MGGGTRNSGGAGGSHSGGHGSNQAGGRSSNESLKTYEKPIEKVSSEKVLIWKKEADHLIENTHSIDTLHKTGKAANQTIKTSNNQESQVKARLMKESILRSLKKSPAYNDPNSAGYDAAHKAVDDIENNK